jgi:hypothetical protein
MWVVAARDWPPKQTAFIFWRLDDFAAFAGGVAGCQSLSSSGGR